MTTIQNEWGLTADGDVLRNGRDTGLDVVQVAGSYQVTDDAGEPIGRPAATASDALHWALSYWNAKGNTFRS